ncbi:GntR family transcriptional regulator [Streptoalloteichus hindustanus]|uniref:Regulatory protein, gntR family n=1 Tax=Streptoalloteichus hindustanus TaxID=2017 RepID=A0A1M5QH66_STRHI|nr:GntR family transcriptional regulator [Streptoalloteichus hindustanus]SHH13150.1 regulatory protein, gntR family [Streptoalloteichus hindustanus]
MSIDPADRRPAYEQIAAHLEAMIGEDAYEPGELLPSNPTLEKQFQVSNITIRNAVKILVNKGLVAVRQGKGAVVLRKPDVRPEVSGVPDDIVRLLKELRTSVEALDARMKAVERALEGQGAAPRVEDER